MLQLKDIKKDYEAAGESVHALKGITLNFRKNEFVSILGASGCGKTTLLNIIGGLDKYTSGDLIINGVSTKQFKDGDWDTYRNHSIGFIFQSYHLIPHQTILSNVELALTIAGVTKEERRARAIEALEKVGLKDKIHNRPNQLSGGQAQRVAIARALINDPDIVLADEPTGALDSKTSVQIMELLKEISKDRLVIMVTHNPELAEQYSTRIVRLFDGMVTDDSMPYDGEEKVTVEAAAAEEPEKKGNKKKASMGVLTAFMLSLKNLLSKWRRTLMVSIAGSIGIIGVSMVLAISAGVQNYIKNMENDMLSGNPITITQSTFDWAAVTNINDTLSKDIDIFKLDNKIYVDSLLQTMLAMGNNFIALNSITEEYVDYVSKMPEEYYSALQYEYDFDIANYIYTDFNMVSDISQTVIPAERDSSSDGMSLTAIRSMYGSILNEEPDYRYYTSMLDTFTGLGELPANADYILSQYDVVGTNGNLSEAQIKEALTDKGSLVLVLDEGNVSELDMAQYGFLSQEELLNYAFKAADNGKYDPEIGLVGNGVKGEDPYYNEEAGAGGLDFELFFKKHFKVYTNDNIYTKLQTPISMPLNGVTKTIPFIYNPYSEGFTGDGVDLGVKVVLQKKSDISYGCLGDGLYYTAALTDYILDSGADSEIARYISDNGDLDAVSYSYNYTYYKDESGTREYIKSLASSLFKATSGNMLSNVPSYTVSAAMVAGSDLATAMSIYPADFKAKDKICEYLDEWNNMCEAGTGPNGIELGEEDKVKYSDMVGLIISMINTMVEMITIALVAFTALSLVVSTVMVGIITYVSVVERIKEIGILRSIGARKKDIKRLFTSETFIIGLAAGIFGIVVTYLLSIVINVIVGSITGIYTIAALPVGTAFIMIAISVLLTLISGLIPASAAAKKDPVIALRTE